MHLLACTAPLDSAVPVAPDPYVQLDGVDYADFGTAFEDAVDGSVIEFCGEWDGPFTRREGLSELTIAGCEMEWAVLDGQSAGTVLRVDVERLWLSEFTMTSGVAASEDVPCDGGTYEDTGNDCTTDRSAFVDRVSIALDAFMVALTDAVLGPGVGLALQVGADGSHEQTSVLYTGGAIHRNFREPDENGVPALGVLVLGTRQRVAFLEVDWGTGEDENGCTDIDEPFVDDDEYDLSGIVDALCATGKGCIIEEL